MREKTRFILSDLVVSGNLPPAVQGQICSSSTGFLLCVCYTACFKYMRVLSVRMFLLILGRVIKKNILNVCSIYFCITSAVIIFTFYKLVRPSTINYLKTQQNSLIFQLTE